MKLVFINVVSNESLSRMSPFELLDLKYCIKETDLVILDSPEYKAARFLQDPLNDVLDEMNLDLAKYEPKRKWLDSLVRF